ncbi:response regulator transcription factor [Alkalicella caledoniensis]|uniref:Stage 0 sporulation protein A homolog n=1 Tax=Alkalicella caledoniensis TaxID=2731377 RepID=A0A7G9W765_ALKCA|nr:response regulator transcription factor [Alkalicella caledoniensis]
MIILSKKILIIEDEQEIAELIKDYLTVEGYCVEIAYDGLTGLNKVKSFIPDLLILDIMLPKLSGLDICKEIRKSDECLPIIIVSAKHGDIDTVLGLGLGADDYLAKPFSPSVLVARVKALLRRCLVSSEESTNTTLVFGELSIDTAGYNVLINGQEVDLPTKEFELLKFLALNPKQVFSRDQLYEQIWGYDSLGEATTVTVHIKRLRQKIEKNPAEPKFIRTVWGVGYKFEA